MLSFLAFFFFFLFFLFDMICSSDLVFGVALTLCCQIHEREESPLKFLLLVLFSQRYLHFSLSIGDEKAMFLYNPLYDICLIVG